jgi:hypothetical protein
MLLLSQLIQGSREPQAGMSQTATLLPRTNLFEFIHHYVLAIYLPGNVGSRHSFLKALPFFYGTWIALLENVIAKLEGRTNAT